MENVGNSHKPVEGHDVPIIKTIIDTLGHLRIDKGSRAVNHVIDYSVGTTYSTATI